MLNCCIERKRARDEVLKVLERSKGGDHSEQLSAAAKSAYISTREATSGKSWDSWSDSEEEFFECLSDQGEMEAPRPEGEGDVSKKKAEGRMQPYNNITLLHSTELLYVPLTQVKISLSSSLIS